MQTPEKTTGFPSLETPTKHMGNNDSPSVKRALSFSYFEPEVQDDPQPSAAKKMKAAEKTRFIKIRELDYKKRQDGVLNFRVVLLKAFEKDNRVTVRVEGMDDTGTVAMVAFHPYSLEIYKKLEVNKAYSMDSFQVTKANANYDTNVSSIIIKNHTKIEPIEDTGLPDISLNRKVLDEVFKMKEGTFTDAVVVCVQDLGGGYVNGTLRRMFHIADSSWTRGGVLTLWAREAEAFGNLEKPIVLGLRNVMVTESMDTKLLTSRGTSSIIRNYGGDDADTEMAWFMEMDAAKRAKDKTAEESIENTNGES